MGAITNRVFNEWLKEQYRQKLIKAMSGDKNYHDNIYLYNIYLLKLNQKKNLVEFILITFWSPKF